MTTEQVNGKDIIHGSKHRVQLDLSYKHEDSRASALQLVLAVQPQWKGDEEHIQLSQCTEGITNTLLKVVNQKPLLSKQEIDDQAMLLRAYGQGTEKMIDRKMEIENHERLMEHGLAPELLACFQNGTLYRFVRGNVTVPADFQRRNISMAIARRLAQWHCLIPCKYDEGGVSKSKQHGKATSEQQLGNGTSQVAAGKPSPNLWTVIQKWILALPTVTQAQRERQEILQLEFLRSAAELSQRPGLGADGLVFSHCDLISGNVIILPGTGDNGDNGDNDAGSEVAFIDFEYATPSPAAFDIANHFSEWGGFECDYSKLPTRAQRREFIDQYLKTYRAMRDDSVNTGSSPTKDSDTDVESLMEEVDLFRGIPGYYWGLWALAQASNLNHSNTEFNYATYAETRLEEYWAWRAAGEGRLAECSAELQLREMRWATAE